MIIRRGITNAKMENNRGQAGAMPAKSVNIRDLESPLRDAGVSRSQSKMYVARYKALEGLSEEQLREAANRDNPTLRDAEAEPGNLVEELMERIQKLI